MPHIYGSTVYLYIDVFNYFGLVSIGEIIHVTDNFSHVILIAITIHRKNTEIV